MLKCYIKLKVLHKDGTIEFKDRELLVPIDDEKGVKTTIFSRYIPILSQDYPNCLISGVTFIKKCEVVNEKKGFEDKELEEMTAEELQDYIVKNDVYEAPIYNQADIAEMPELIKEAEQRKIEKKENEDKKNKKISQADINSIVKTMEEKNKAEREEDKKEIEALREMVRDLVQKLDANESKTNQVRTPRNIQKAPVSVPVSTPVSVSAPVSTSVSTPVDALASEEV